MPTKLLRTSEDGMRDLMAIRPKIPSKRNGRKGTRKDWKKKHPPVKIWFPSYQTAGISQRILSEKHMRGGNNG